MCEKDIFEHPSMVKHRGERKYCSIACRDTDPDHTDRLIRLNHIQNRSKLRNKLECVLNNLTDIDTIFYSSLVYIIFPGYLGHFLSQKKRLSIRTLA